MSALTTDKSNRKVLLGNFTSLLILRGFDFILPLLTLPFLVRTIGIENYGLVSFALALALYFGALIQYGFQVTATREVARHREDEDVLSRIYSTTISVSFLFALIGAVIFFTIVMTVPRFRTEALLFIFAYLLVSSQSLFPVWFFQGIEKMRFIAQLTMTGRVLYVVALFSIVREPEDYQIVPLINAVSAMTILATSIWLIRYRFGVIYQRPKGKDIYELVRDGRHAFITQFAPTLYNNTTTLLLGFFVSAEQLGQFVSSTKIVQAMISLSNIIGRVFLPYLSRNIEQHGKFLLLMLFMGSTLTLGTILASNFVVELLFTSKNAAIANYLQFLSPRLFFAFCINALGFNYLMLVGQEKRFKNIVFFTSVAFFLIAICIIPLFGVSGALATLIGAPGMIAFLAFLSYNKDKRASYR